MKPYLHYLIPRIVAGCQEDCRDGYAILTPLADNPNKYILQSNCNHELTEEMRAAVKKYYTRIKKNASEHREACKNQRTPSA